MLSLAFLIFPLALAAILLRGSAIGPLDRIERWFLMAAPIPIVVGLVLPGPVRSAIGGSTGAKAAAVWLSAIGGWLSLALLLAGILLTLRRWKRDEGWDRRLLVGVVVSGVPAMLIGLVALMYAL